MVSARAQKNNFNLGNQGKFHGDVKMFFMSDHSPAVVILTMLVSTCILELRRIYSGLRTATVVGRLQLALLLLLEIVSSEIKGKKKRVILSVQSMPQRQNV